MPTALGNVAPIKHGQLGTKALQCYLCAVPVNAVLILPLAGAQLALDVGHGAFLEVLLCHAHQSLVEDCNRVPFCTLAALTGVAVFPVLRGGDPQIADLATVQECADLRAMPRQSLHYILSDKFGCQVRYVLVQKKMLKIKKAIGLEEYSLHGLRYSAAGELAEAGCTDHQIAAITDHKSLSMIQKYSRGASQKVLAKQAQSLREQNKNKT